jgi:hypothetical protein
MSCVDILSSLIIGALLRSGNSVSSCTEHLALPACRKGRLGSASVIALVSQNCDGACTHNPNEI